MSDIGTFLQTVGAAWLMVSLGAGPMYVALIQTASALPFFVFAVPAGADIVDRRRLILYTEFWMVGVATVLTVVTREDLAALSALNGIEFNVARAVGPPLGGVIIAVAGVGVAFSLNALSFAGVIVLVARWSKDRFWLGPSTHVPGMRAHALLRQLAEPPCDEARAHERTSGDCVGGAW